MFRSRPPTQCAILGVLFAALLAGCGSENPDVSTPKAASSVTQAPAAPPTIADPEPSVETNTTAPDSALQAEEVVLDTSVFFGPHRYELGTATLVPTDGGGELRIDVIAENVSDETFDPAGSKVWLSVGDLAAGYSQDNLDSTPAKAKVGGDLVFTVDETFTMSAAALHFGELTENSSLVPLNGDLATTYPAKSITPPAEASGDMWTVTPSAVTVHAQDLWGGYSVDAGQGFMVIDFVATLDAESRSLNVSTGSFSLTLPDGTTAPAPGGGYPGVNEVVTTGQSTPEASIAYSVPLEVPGDYIFTFSPSDEETIQMPFSIE